MVRYFIHPDTGRIESTKTVRSIKQKYGAIPYFVSKSFALAYKHSKDINIQAEKLIGSVPAIGWSKKDLQPLIRPTTRLYSLIVESFKPKEVEEIAEKPKEPELLFDWIYSPLGEFYERIDSLEQQGDKMALIKARQEIKQRTGKTERFKYLKQIIASLDKSDVLTGNIKPKKRGSKPWQERKAGYIKRHGIKRVPDNPDIDSWRLKQRKAGQRYRERQKQKELNDYL